MDEYMLLLAYNSGFPKRDGSGLGYWDFYSANRQKEDAVDAMVTGKFSLFGRSHDLVLGGSHNAVSIVGEDVGFLERGYPDTAPDIFKWTGWIPRPGTYRTGRAANTVKTRENGAYGMVRLNPVDGVKLIAGGRYSDWRQENVHGAVSEVQSAKRFTPYLGAVVDLTEDIALFASYADVFKPNSARDRNNRLLAPMTGANYEAGVKAELLDKRLYVALSGFHMRQRNLAVPDPDVPPNSLPGGGSAYKLIGGAKSWGGEIEITGSPVAGLSLAASYTFSRTEDEKGSREPFRLTPLHVAGLDATWAVRPDLTIGGGVRYQSMIGREVGMPTGIADPVERTGRSEQKGYALVDLMARYRINDRLSVALNASNLFDKNYYVNVGFFNIGNFGEGRRIMASLRATM